jgi:class 3 adenylate cyclase/predicted ATPase
MKFCGQCAAALSRSCAQCGFENPSEFTFCGQCGNAFGTEPKERASPEAERRHLTVMFCDQVNSVARSQRLDPEEISEITHQYQAACAKVIRNFDGSIGQYQGDGLLVYFGYPVAHEDDAQRAVRAGLGILAELPHLNAQLQQTMQDLQDFPLQLRIGIHTGLAVVGEMGAGERRELMALGDTPNLASRLQGLATSDTVLISEATYRLAGGFFACRDLGPQQLKGVSLPLEVYQVVGESGMRSRLQVSAAAGLTPLVGRKEELGLLTERWEQVKEGEGWVVMVSGEAGIGKSRLVQALKERLAQEPHLCLWLECHCSPYHQNSALSPVIDLLQRLLRFEREEAPQEKFTKLESVLQRFPLSLLEIMPLFASLLSLPLPDRYPPLTLTPQRQRQKLQEALLALLMAQTEQQPVLQVVEDLHWADPSTLETLNFFVNHGSITRSLMLFTFRPEFSPPWVTRSHVTQLTLNRLSRKQVEEMTVGVTKGKTLPAEVTHQLVTKTDGVPLFVEELTKMVLESGWLKEEANRYILTGALPSVGIPATLHDSLMARLDRLGPVKEVAQLGATLGREFSYELLKAVSPLDEAALYNALNQLVEVELLYRRRLPSQELYVFKHALIQEAAYQGLLKSTRQQSHKQIAQVLQERFPEIVETQPELLAHHYTAAGLVEEAIPCWQRAGQRAVERSANVEAASHLNKGLELLKALPETPERIQQELQMQTLLGSALMATKGFAAPEVGAAFTRARELCQDIGETPQLFPVLRGLAAFYSVRADYKTTQELAEQCLRLAQRQQDPSLLLGAHFEIGVALFCLGEFIHAREHWEQVLALYESEKHRAQTVLYGQDIGVSCLSRMTRLLWFLGYPDQALKRGHAAVALAQEVSHPFSLAYALNFVTECHRLCGEVQAARERAEEAIRLSTEQGFSLWATTATMLQGWTLAMQGQGEEGIAQLRQGLAIWQAMGAEMARPHWLALLAEVYGRTEQSEKGLPLLDEALAVVNNTGEREYEAELYRLKGQLTLQSKTSLGQVSDKSQASQDMSEVPNTQHLAPSTQVEAEAEACFLKAIEIARRQQAKSWELRATISLSRLWLRQGKQAEARRMMAEIYGWFTEGFDTADLREARTLLEEIR